MLGYVTLGANDHEAALKFYDALFAVCGGQRLMDMDGFVLYGDSMDTAGVAIVRPHDGNAATVGNGVMAALRMPSTEKVDEVYAKALELGGTDEGPTGDRGGGFYAGYFRDPEGNKLCAFNFGA